MYNDQQLEYYKTVGSEKLKKKMEKEKEASAFRNFMESPCYQQIKQKFLEMAAKTVKYEPTQEGLLHLHGETKYKEGLLEFFNEVERKAK